MVNKRGQDLSIGTLILIVLGIIVLVLLILGFSMGWSNLWDKINIFGGTSGVGDIVLACKLASTSQDTYTLCNKEFKIDKEIDTFDKADGQAKDGKVKCKELQASGSYLKDIDTITC